VRLGIRRRCSPTLELAPAALRRDGAGLSNPPVRWQRCRRVRHFLDRIASYLTFFLVLAFLAAAIGGSAPSRASRSALSRSRLAANAFALAVVIPQERGDGAKAAREA
jgi:hypothetical protein